MFDPLTLDPASYEQDVHFSFEVAERLSQTLTSAASKVELFTAARIAAQQTASVDFSGNFADLFQANMSQCSDDEVALRDTLLACREIVDALAEEARKENQRRATIRAWIAEHDDWYERAYDYVFGVDGPVFDEEIRPSRNFPECAIARRETPTEPSGKSMGVSSARPSNLFSASDALSLAGSDLIPAGVVQSDLDDFTAQCKYGVLTVGNLVSAYENWRGLNNRDVEWLRTIAAAFAEAGGQEELTALSDYALYSALEIAGIEVRREGLELDPVALGGLDPQTGYALDPVNTATGNFIEPEVDIVFLGLNAGLSATRMYNSISDTEGLFGWGWCSIFDQRLQCEDDEEWVWVRPDGGRVVFQLSQGNTHRSVSGNFWLNRGVQQHLVSDNAGNQWIFDLAGRWLGSAYGQGRSVHAVWNDDSLSELRTDSGVCLSVEYIGSRIVRLTASDGRWCEYDYDERQRLVGVRGRNVRRRYEWNQDGLLCRVFDAHDVLEVENTYDSIGRVVNQRTRHGRSVRFAYLSGGITVISDPDGTRSDTWISDRFGRTVGIVDSQGQRSSFSYDQWGNCVVETDRLGARTLHTYDARGRRIRTVLPTGGEFRFEWDERDRCTLVMNDSGSVTSFEYDSAESRNPCRIHDPLGGVTELEWDGALLRHSIDAAGVKLSYEHDRMGNLTGMTNADGARVAFEYDESGRMTSVISPSGIVTAFSYDSHGHPIQVRDGSGAQWATVYDRYGRLLSRTDPYGARTTFAYNAEGELEKVTDPLGREWSHRYDDLGNVTALGRPDGTSIGFAYDTLSRLKEMRSASGNTWQWDYDVNGGVSSVTDPTGVTQRSHFDAATRMFSYSGLSAGRFIFDEYGRPIEHRHDSELDDATAVVYDAAGNVVELLDAEGGLTVFRRDVAGRLIERTSPEGRTTLYEYDHLGRLSVVENHGERTCFDYDVDGRVVAQLNSDGTRATFEYDACHRLVAARIPGVGRVERSYDKCGRLIYARDTVSGIRRFRYDKAGQLIAAINGVGGVTRFEWDECSRLTRKTDPAGGVHRFVYDADGRLVERSSPGGGGLSATFDSAGRIVSQSSTDGRSLSFAYADGRLMSVTAGEKTSIVYEYLGADRQVIVRDSTSPTGATLEHVFTYDRLGRLVERSSGKMTWKWSYDADSYLVGRSGPNGIHTSFTRDFLGRITRVDDASVGVITCEYSEDGRSRETRWGKSVERLNVGTDGFVSDYSLTDPNGQRWSASLAFDEWGCLKQQSDAYGTWRFSYDEAHELVQVERENAVEAALYSYDSAGRLCSAVEGDVTSHFTYGDGSELLSWSRGQSTCSYSYDAAGRRIAHVSADRSLSLGWDARGWLKSVSEMSENTGSSTHEVWVNALGELTQVGQHALTWDAASTCGGLASVDGEQVFSFHGLTFVGGQLIASSWRPGSPQGIAGVGTSVFCAEQVNQGLVSVGAGGTPIVAGYAWMGARLLDVESRSFLSHDPLHAGPGVIWESNPYNWAANNPLTLQDPAGLTPITDADLAEFSQANSAGWLNNALSAAGQFFDDHAYVLSGLAIAFGVALIATGVGSPLGVAVLSGALISGGISVGTQKYSNGTVNWRRAGVDALIGGALGGFGAGAGNLVSSALVRTSSTAQQALLRQSSSMQLLNVTDDGMKAMLNGETELMKALTVEAAENSAARHAYWSMKTAGDVTEGTVSAFGEYGVSVARGESTFDSQGLGIATAKSVFRGHISGAANMPSLFGNVPKLVTRQSPLSDQMRSFGQRTLIGTVVSSQTLPLDTLIMQSANGSTDGVLENGLGMTASQLGENIHDSFPGLHVSLNR